MSTGSQRESLPRVHKKILSPLQAFLSPLQAFLSLRFRPKCLSSFFHYKMPNGTNTFLIYGYCQGTDSSAVTDYEDDETCRLFCEKEFDREPRI